MTKQYLLKSGKGFRGPGIFLNPQIDLDGKVIHYALNNFKNENGDGLDHIDGLVINLKDYASIKGRLKFGQSTLGEFIDTQPIRSIDDRVRILDPCLDFLIRGTEDDVNNMSASKVFDRDLIDKIMEISSERIQPVEKVRRTVQEVYPKIHVGVVRALLKWQIDEKADMIVTPSVPITSTRYITQQLITSKQILQKTHHLLDTVFAEAKQNHDVMNLLSINAPIITETQYWQPIIDVLLNNDYDQVGIRVTNLDKSNESQVQTFWDFIAEVHTSMKAKRKLVPIHVINVDQLGYLSFCYGNSTVTMPIASDPYFYAQRIGKSISPARKGSYYVPARMTYYTYDRLLKETRENGYRLPCHCPACDKYETILKAENYFPFNEFRRIHDVLYKNIENQMFRNVTVPFHLALKDMLARSRVAWVSYVPDNNLASF